MSLTNKGENGQIDKNQVTLCFRKWVVWRCITAMNLIITFFLQNALLDSHFTLSLLNAVVLEFVFAVSFSKKGQNN